MTDGYEKTIEIEHVGEVVFAIPTGEAMMNFMKAMKAKTVIVDDEMRFEFDPFANPQQSIRFVSTHIRRWSRDEEVTYANVARLPMTALMMLVNALAEAQPDGEELEKN